MERVARVFHHQRRFWLEHEDGSRLFSIERAQFAFGRLSFRPKDCEWWLLEIMDGRPFPEEFGIGAQFHESGRGRFEYGSAIVEDGGQHAAADYHNLLPAELRESQGNLVTGAKQVSRINLPVGAARGGYRYEAQLGFTQCFFDVDGGAQQSCLPSLCDFLRQTTLHNRRTAFVDDAYLIGVNVDAPDAVSRAGQTSGRNCAHVTETDDADVHELTLR